MTLRRIALLAALGAIASVFACNTGAVATRSFPIDGRPSAVVVADGLVWVADDATHSLHVLDATDGSSAGRRVLVPRNPIALAAGPGSVWVGHATGEVTRVETSSKTHGGPADVGASITGIAVVGDIVWAADLPDDTLVKIDGRNSEVVKRAEVPGGVVRVAASGPEMWVTNRERSVTEIDSVSGKAGRSIDVGEGPIGLAVSGGRVWVANSDGETVSMLDASSGESIGPAITVGRGPVAVAVAGESAWVANQDSRTLTRLDAESGAVLGEPIPLGMRPRGLAADENGVWAVGTNPSAVVHVQVE